jgi:hypothetical protein
MMTESPVQIALYTTKMPLCFRPSMSCGLVGGGLVGWVILVGWRGGELWKRICNVRSLNIAPLAR